MMRDCVHFPSCAEYADVEKRCNPGCQFYCPGENVEVVAVDDALDFASAYAERWYEPFDNRDELYKQNLNQFVDELAGKHTEANAGGQS